MELRILLTGSNGFIGSSALQHFISSSVSVHLLKRGSSLSDQFRVLNLKYPIPLSKLLLIHCASATPVNTSAENIFQDNIRFALDICSANLEFQLLSGIINLSSMSVYGQHSTPLVTESTVPKCLSPYGASKLAVEQIFTSHCDLNHIQCTNLRLPGVVGPRSLERSRNLVSTIKNNCSLGLPLVLSNPESLFNNIVHISTLLDILDMLSASTSIYPSVINLASTQPLRLSELVSIIASQYNANSCVSWVSRDQIPFTISTDLAVETGLPLISTRTVLARLCADIQ
jgi:nucleoside-diphosphate-sugar epimerase